MDTKKLLDSLSNECKRSGRLRDGLEVIFFKCRDVLESHDALDYTAYAGDDGKFSDGNGIVDPVEAERLAESRRVCPQCEGDGWYEGMVSDREQCEKCHGTGRAREDR